MATREREGDLEVYFYFLGHSMDLFLGFEQF